MDLLRHWVVVGPTERWAKAFPDEATARQWIAGWGTGFRVEGPFVPAEQLEGAVEALREEAADLRARYADPHRGTLIEARDVAAKLEALVTRFGGQ